MSLTHAPVRATGHQYDLPVVRITARRGWLALDLPELWAYRELLYFFIWRDIKVRYKQTVIGAAWAVLQCDQAHAADTLSGTCPFYLAMSAHHAEHSGQWP